LAFPTLRGSPGAHMATQTATHTRPSWLFTLEGVVLIIAVLYWAKPIIIPLALAILLTFVLTPIVILVQARGLTRVPAVLTVVGLAFAILGAIGWGVGVQVQHLARDLPGHQQEIKQKIDSLRSSEDGTISRLIRMIEEIGNSDSDLGSSASKLSDASKDRPV